MRRDPPAEWAALGVETVRGDLDDAEALTRLCDGADLTIHNAGLVKARSRAAFDAVNVAGARRLAEAAVRVPQVIHVSSLTAREPALSHYSASKAAGEAAMTDVLGERLTIARPCAIYGPGDRELLPVFQAAAASPVLPLLSPRGRVAMIHVADAARQIVALADARPGLRVALSDSRPEGYSWREMMAAAARAAGRNPAFAPVPGALVRAIGVTNDFTILFGRTPMLTSAKARELLHPNWAIAPEERPWAPPPPIYDLEGGFSATVAWYRAAGWMKH